MLFRSLTFQRIIDAILGALVLFAGFFVVWVGITFIDLPPVEVKGALAINTPIKPGEDLIIRELLIKRRQCPSRWTVNVVRRSDNLLVHSYTALGGFAPVTAPEVIEAVLFPVSLPPKIAPGEYVARVYGEYGGCGSWTRSSWQVIVPDVFFTVEPLDKKH